MVEVQQLHMQPLHDLLSAVEARPPTTIVELLEDHFNGLYEVIMMMPMDGSALMIRDFTDGEVHGPKQSVEEILMWLLPQLFPDDVVVDRDMAKYIHFRLMRGSLDTSTITHMVMVKRMIELPTNHQER